MKLKYIKNKHKNIVYILKQLAEERQEAAESCQNCLRQAEQALRSGDYGLIVLDEVVDAVNEGFVDVKELISVLNHRADATEVVLTGRNPKDEIVETADYLTVMSALKHPYTRGVGCRRGIEF